MCGNRRCLVTVHGSQKKVTTTTIPLERDPPYLVREYENEDRCAFDGCGEVTLSRYVVREFDAGQVLDVLVLLVDDVRQTRLLALVENLLGEHPLPNLALEALLQACVGCSHIVGSFVRVLNYSATCPPQSGLYSCRAQKDPPQSGLYGCRAQKYSRLYLVPGMSL